MVTVIDGENLLLGRLASIVAQRILAGEEIAIINAEKVIVSGSRAMVIEEYYTKRARGSVEGGPFYPRRPDHIVKRTIRGMIPYKMRSGAAAFRRVKIYVGTPYEFKEAEAEVLEAAHRDRLSNARYVTVGAISTNLGAKY
ncbi:MAG: 50S ribosomal protein L13 [Methanocalculaceae archaeon]|jgi:large subunit ribosomal protein L13|nr:50S ribosomal protein L13 [Methanocalculaceae archaeon]